MIRILVISNFRNYISVRPEAEIFIGLRKRGFEIDIMTYGDSPYIEEFEQAGITVTKFHPEKKLDKQEIKIINDKLINGKHDIVHLSNGKAILNGIQAAKNLPVKIVLYRGYTGNIHWYDPTAYLKYLHPRVGKIFCIAEATKEHIQNQLFFDKSKAVGIHKGHRLSWYKDIKPISRENLPEIPKDGFWIINVANNRRMKGIPFLIKAMDEINPDLPIHLLLVGNNMDDKINMKLINRNRNKHKIHLIGYRKDALTVVKACDVFVLSSIKGEAITKSVIEAMSMGIPPVITNIPGNRDLVKNGVSGLVVPAKDSSALANAILKLYSNRDLCSIYGQGAKKQIEKEFNINDTILKMEKLYKELMLK